MLDINKLQAGRRYSFVYSGNVETVKTREGRTAPEWLQRATVARCGVFSGNAADERTYTNMMERADADYTPSGKSWFFHHPEQNGIVLHKSSQKPYLCVLHPRTQKTDYTVNGIPATAEQLEAIRFFKKNGNRKSKFAVYPLEGVTCQGYIEDFSDEDIED
jgi:hypothetical protein